MFNGENELMYHIHCKKGDIGKYVILPGDPFRCELIASFLDDARLIAHNREHKSYTGFYNGVMVSVTSTGMGGGSTAICVEELIKCGAENLFRIGTCGRISDEAKDESLDGCIITAAVRDEGTTLHYIPAEYPAIADRHLVEALAQGAEKLGYKYMEGIIQTKDSYFGQVEPENMPAEKRLNSRMECWKRGNVAVTDMESATLFIVSQIRRVKAASIMSFKETEKSIKTILEAIRILEKGKQ
ncbi:MAG: nucleoside phosphorylase [Erysipelotrichaceae bacterium]|nr:nucleoside phosphorylase [Erysipelotrichaceae bacterium]